MVNALQPISVNGRVRPSFIQSPFDFIGLTPFQETGISPGRRSVSSLRVTLRVASSSPPACPHSRRWFPSSPGTLSSSCRFGETSMLPV